MNEIEFIKFRLFSLLDSKKLHLAELFKLIDIRFDDRILTAAVTFEKRSTLLLNKKFIEEHCRTDEHLFMLVMHEMYHIILGHTRLLDKKDIIDNIVFDAIINASLCREFNNEKYTSFFKELNSDSILPGALLRPIGVNTPEIVKPILNHLYNSVSCTYYELYKFIEDNKEEILKNIEVITLLGNHEGEQKHHPLLEDFFKKHRKIWEIKLNKGEKGAGYSTYLNEEKQKLEQVDKVKKKKMCKLLEKASITSTKHSQTKIIERVKEDSTFPLINYKDRTFVAKKMSYPFIPLLYNNEFSNYRCKLIKRKVLVYIDVSGSVFHKISTMLSLLLPAYRNNEINLRAFSNKVEPIKYKDLRKGKYKTTGGTDFNCVFNDYFKINKNSKSNKVLILTDCEGPLEKNLEERIKKEHIKIYLGVVDNKNYRDRILSKLATYVEEIA